MATIPWARPCGGQHLCELLFLSTSAGCALPEPVPSTAIRPQEGEWFPPAGPSNSGHLQQVPGSSLTTSRLRQNSRGQFKPLGPMG